ncbi:MAG: nicotinate-nucleotide adenylyltransferase [Gallionellaceae bacterium]|jgi:nicotinate-nucleotide adenylyltransferase|nr:nicotinate-nucleotide adenylyltransferase [Gallionellaceae bacterium]
MTSIAPLGLLGVTFDPIHHGHLRLAQEALEQCGLAAVHFIPSGVPPHRAAPRTAAAQRLEMTRLALRGNPAFILDEREIHRTDPCYTVDTLTSLRAEVGDAQPLCLLMGADAFLQLQTWREWKKLFTLAHIIAVQRAGSHPLGNRMEHVDIALRAEYQARLAPSPKALHESPAGSVLVLDMPALEISATDIRRRCADGRSIRYLLPDAVSAYIHSNHLYAHAEH